MCSRGSVVPFSINQIKVGELVTVTDPSMSHFLLNLDKAVGLICFALEHASSGDLFIQKAPVSTARNLAEAAQEPFQKIGMRAIGMRYGERLFETLVTCEGMLRAEGMGDNFRAHSDSRDLNSDKFFVKDKVRTQADESYTGHSTRRLDIAETVEKNHDCQIHKTCIGGPWRGGHSMRFLIPSCSGMAGHAISIYLRSAGVMRSASRGKASRFLDEQVIGDTCDERLPANTFSEGSFDAAVNCVGVLNQFTERDPESAVCLNGVLLHILARLTKELQTRVFHMSTACVFVGNAGSYTEASMPDGQMVNDRTKTAGELRDGKDLAFRNFIVEPDINPARIGRFNWFMAQDGSIKGFSSAIWTGLTTLGSPKRWNALPPMAYAVFWTWRLLRASQIFACCACSTKTCAAALLRSCRMEPQARRGSCPDEPR